MTGWTPAVRAFLAARRVGHLATANAAGAPHVVPVCYALDDDALYFVADDKPKRRPPRELLRLQNLLVNPHAALVVDDYADDWSQLAYVLVRGPAHVVRDPATHDVAIALLRVRYPQYVAMALDDPDRTPVVRITPERVVSWRAAR